MATTVRTFGSGSEARSQAWAFMRECDARGVQAGFPSLTEPYTVAYIATEPAPGAFDGMLTLEECYGPDAVDLEQDGEKLIVVRR